MLAAHLMVASLLVSCATSEGFEQVEQTDHDDRVALPTTSILELDRPTSTTTAPAAPVSGPDATLASLVGQLALDPAAIAAVGQLANPDPAALAAIFGLDQDLLGQLGLTLSQVQGIAAIVAGTDPAAIAASFGAGLGGAVDLSALHRLVNLAERLDATALALVGGLTQPIINAVVTTVGQAMDRVDPTLMTVLAAVLAHLDPFGLGRMTADPANTAMLAVFTGAALRTNPTLVDQLRPAVATNAELSALVDHLEGIGQTLDPSAAASLVTLGSKMTPEGLATLTGLVQLVQDPTVRELIAGLRP